MPLLCDLPDEILLDVIRCLQAIRSFKTQSVAFRRKETEKGRQYENHARQRTLYALCLTSHRLRYLSLPTLYASSITCATRSGLRQLQLLHRTIGSPNNALGQTKHLAEYVRYVENRLADYQGNSLQDDEVFQQESVSAYFQLLGNLVLCAPNIEHLCVVSLEHNDVSFWIHVLGTSLHPIRHGPAKLEHLSTQIHTYAWSSVPGVSIFERILQHVQFLPMLSELRVSGATTERDYDVAFHAGEVANLRRLDLTESNLEIVEVADLLLACKNLRHFTCKWAFLNNALVGPSILHTALLARADTLETLSLDWREVRHSHLIQSQSKLLGSLRSLRHLRSLEICEVGFLSNDLSLLDFPDQTLEYALSELLPESLEEMTLLTSGDINSHGDDILDNALCLWQFTVNRRTLMPHLKTVCIKAGHQIFTPGLVNAFGKAGVRLYTEIEM